MRRALMFHALLVLLMASAGCDQDGSSALPDADTGLDTALDTPLDTGLDTEPDTAEDTEPDTAEDPIEEDPGSTLDPPAGASSGGSGGGAANGETRVTAVGGITYRIIAPGGAGPHPMMIIFSGTEGGATMTSNIQSLAPALGMTDIIYAILDGVDYWENGEAGAYVLDHVRGMYDIDNDRTYLLSESAGTRAGLELGLSLRQSYFAAYWANDVNARATPTLTATELGFAPYGNAGPGGDWPDANAIVSGMEAAGYRCPAPAPYDGPGSGTHGSSEQFVAAMQWFPGKTRL